MSDQDLEIFLSEYRNQNPTELQLQKWKRTVRNELKPAKASRPRLWLHWVAASIIGFVVGSFIFKSSYQTQDLENLSDSATVEYVFTKTY